MKQLKWLTLLFVLGFANFAKTEDVVHISKHGELYRYTIRPADNLSSLMYSMGFSSMGIADFIQRVTELNIDNIRKNGDLIFMGHKLFLPARPFFLCNVILNRKEVRLKYIVRTDLEYESLKNSFNSDCKQQHRDKAPLAKVIPEAIPERIEKPKLINEQTEFKRFRRIEIIPRVGYSKIKGVEIADNSSVEILSTLNYGVTLAWKQVW